MTDHDATPDPHDPSVAAGEPDAAAVIASVDTLNANVVRLRKDLELKISRANKAIRRTHITGIAIVVLLLMVAVLAVQGNRTAHRADDLAEDIVNARTVARYNSCVVDNELRAAVVDSVRGSAETLVSVLVPDRAAASPETQRRADAYLAGVDESLAPAAERDCSPRALEDFYNEPVPTTR